MKRFFINLFFSGVIFSGLFSVCANGQEKMIYQETFDYPDGVLPAKWWSEGVPAVIRDGRLFVDADTIEPRVSTIWLSTEFSGNLAVEFDVHVTSSVELANNLNFFFMYSDPSRKSIEETRDERADGLYSRYHKLNGYVFTHLANGTEIPARFRFRYNPGFNLVHELYDYECKRGVTYHIKIVKNGNRFQYWANGNLIIDKKVAIEQQYDKGIIGFRTYRTSLWWDNVVVTRLDVE